MAKSFQPELLAYLAVPGQRRLLAEGPEPLVQLRVRVVQTLGRKYLLRRQSKGYYNNAENP